MDFQTKITQFHFLVYSLFFNNFFLFFFRSIPNVGKSTLFNLLTKLRYAYDQLYFIFIFIDYFVFFILYLVFLQKIFLFVPLIQTKLVSQFQMNVGNGFVKYIFQNHVLLPFCLLLILLVLSKVIIILKFTFFFFGLYTMYILFMFFFFFFLVSFLKVLQLVLDLEMLFYLILRL
jgi:hypothetical protein